jgi:hypothetical protein
MDQGFQHKYNNWYKNIFMTNPLKNMNILDYYIIIFSIHYYVGNPPNFTLLLLSQVFSWCT